MAASATLPPASSTPAPAASPVSAPSSVMTPEAELAKLQSDPSYGGGNYYGRTPNGIADLVKGGVVQPTGASAPTSGDFAPKPTNPQPNPGSFVVDPNTGIETFQPTPAATTISGSGVSRYGSGSSAPAAPDLNAIRASALSDAQAEIAGIKNQYAALEQQAKNTGELNSGKTRAKDSRSGLLGSDFGDSNEQQTRNDTAAAVAKLDRAMNDAISAVMSKAQNRGDTLARQAQTEEDKQSTAYQTTLKNNQEAAKKDIASLAKGGIPLESLDPTEKAALLEHSGLGESLFDALYNANLPQNQQRKYTYEKLADGSFLPITVDPATGQPVTGAPIVPPNNGVSYDKFQVMPDGTPMFINSKTGAAVVAGTNGTSLSGTEKTNFAKPTAAKTTTEKSADKVGAAWLAQQEGFTVADQEKYSADPVFHAWVNNQAAASTKAKNSGTNSVAAQIQALFNSTAPTK